MTSQERVLLFMMANAVADLLELATPVDPEALKRAYLLRVHAGAMKERNGLELQ